MERGERGRRAAGWAQRRIERYGGPGTAASRFVPGGQTAFSVTAGMLAYPLGRYVLYSAVGAALWAVCGTLAGSLGGRALAAGNWIGLVVALLAVVLLFLAPKLLRRGTGRIPTTDRAGEW
ncbi:DedA family protein [Nocardiopsis akebiae]|uniref:DedA family protein n=1 Tax=Nocardiopsis TaxID=2013 RepID=UPI0021118096|nr:VTT domain-containing protein [Nocardiopsis akebiae]